MSHKDNLLRKSMTHASGEDGYVAAMEDFSIEYRADASIKPTDFADLNRKQLVCHFGGYLIAHKQLAGKFVYSFADVIYSKWNKINLNASGELIKAQLETLDRELLAEVTAAADKALALGDTGESVSKTIIRQVKELSVIFAAMENPTPRMVDAVQTSIRELEALLPHGEVVSTPQIKVEAVSVK